MPCFLTTKNKEQTIVYLSWMGLIKYWTFSTKELKSLNGKHFCQKPQTDTNSSLVYQTL